ncbi:MAG TPA: ankyrin repeat domain-containing protein [Candidatus Limnocylindria bacterium]|nr:ankyrin repeat domain-containing protein [Candidatus Limnocylindria bacterium]
MSAFFEAIKKGDRAAVERELAADPALARAGEDGVSAVLVATYYGKEELAQLLARRKGDLTIFEAAAVGDLAQVRAHVQRDPSLVNAYAADGFFPLGLAAFFRRPEVVDHLIAQGADVKAVARNPMQVTALHSAVADGGDARIAKALVEAGADVNAKQRHGWTPLHGAAESGDRELVELLLDRGADPRARNDDGRSALDLARARDHTTTVAVLERALAR